MYGVGKTPTYKTVENWLYFWRKNNAYFQPSKRVRHSFLTDSERDDVMDAAKKLRAAPTCEGLTAATVAAVARGVIRRSKPAFLERRGGPAKADFE